jgi:hypothetical protein
MMASASFTEAIAVGSMELAIVVARRSWFEIYLRKTGKYRKKEKGAYEKEERWHPNSRAQPPRSGDCG